METLKLTEFSVVELSITDCVQIDGGGEIDKDSTAYKLGHFVGEALTVVSVFLGLRK
ncbi:MAG: hypothetical protein ACRC54_00180 [Fusobacteriaceae bacterium]